MSLKYLGTVSVGTMIPIFATLSASLSSAVGFFAGESASLQLATQLKTTTPDLTSLTAGLNAALNAVSSISVPTLSASIDAGISARASLLAGISAGMVAAVNLIESVILTSGIMLYAYDGTVSGFTSDLSTSIGSGLPDGTGASGQCYAVVILTSSAATWTTLQRIFKTS